MFLFCASECFFLLSFNASWYLLWYVYTFYHRLCNVNFQNTSWVMNSITDLPLSKNIFSSKFSTKTSQLIEKPLSTVAFPWDRIHTNFTTLWTTPLKKSRHSLPNWIFAPSLAFNLLSNDVCPNAYFHILVVHSVCVQVEFHYFKYTFTYWKYFWLKELFQKGIYYFLQLLI